MTRIRHRIMNSLFSLQADAALSVVGNVTEGIIIGLYIHVTDDCTVI